MDASASGSSRNPSPWAGCPAALGHPAVPRCAPCPDRRPRPGRGGSHRTTRSENPTRRFARGRPGQLGGKAATVDESMPPERNTPTGTSATRRARNSVAQQVRRRSAASSSLQPAGRSAKGRSSSDRCAVRPRRPLPNQAPIGAPRAACWSRERWRGGGHILVGQVAGQRSRVHAAVEPGNARQCLSSEAKAKRGGARCGECPRSTGASCPCGSRAPAIGGAARPTARTQTCRRCARPQRRPTPRSRAPAPRRRCANGNGGSAPPALRAARRSCRSRR